ncbi:MAG: LysR family transcriptional regulator [Lachnospiraceae bacterium]|nr:LysR family transcriptional regulator [Lachnospiraceae bacterium]
MNNKDLEYVLVLAEEKNISSAAKRLFISQPALSLFLSRLEKSLNVTLFTRSTGGLILTYAGERYVAMAQQIEKLYETFEEELESIHSLNRGRLTIGTSAHIGSLCLPQTLPAFEERYPNITVDITEGNSQMLERKLALDELDLALLHLPFKEFEPPCYEVIGKDRYVMAFAKNHPLNQYVYSKAGEKYPYIDPEMAKGEKFILSFPWQRVRQITDRILRNAEITPEIVLTSSSVQTTLRFASAGMGITFLPESYIQLFRCEGDPVFCYMEDFYQAVWTFVIAYSKAGTYSLPAKAFVKHASDYFAERGRI